MWGYVVVCVGCWETKIPPSQTQFINLSLILSLSIFTLLFVSIFIIDESSHTASRTDSPSFHPLMKSFFLFPSLFNFTVFLSYWNPSPQEIDSTTTMQSSFKTVPFNPDFYSQASFFFRYTHTSPFHLL